MPERLIEIGRAMPRAATRRLVAGRGRYLDDLSLKGELHAAFLRSPHAHARFRVSDVSAALALDGVVRVLTARDLDVACRGWTCASRSFPGMVSPEQRALAREEALYQGEPIVMIVARSRALAEDAAELVVVDWTPLAASVSPEAALEPDAPLVHTAAASNLSWGTQIRAGDPESAFAGAALVVSETLRFERKTGVPLEPRGVLASYDPSSRALVVNISHQMPHQLQIHLGELLGLSMSDVRVVCHDVGGGFGIKMHVYPDEIAVCAASRLLGRPIKYVADRVESLASDVHAREHVIAGRMAVDREGRILGFDIDDVQGLGAYSVYPRTSIAEAMSTLRTVGGPYRFEAYQARLRCALQNKVMTGQYRAVGQPIACAITERLVELAAAARSEDSLAFRRRNFLRPDEMPWTSPQGARMADLSHAACLDRLLDIMGLERLRTEITAWRDAGRLIGLGFASFVEFTATGAASYGRAGVPVAAVDTVVVTLEPSGEVKALCPASEIGQGIQQGLAQIIADAVGLGVENIRVVLGDTAVVPHGGGAWSSRGAAITGEAAWGAGRALRAQLLAAAAALLQTDPDGLDIGAGLIVDRNGAERISLAELGRTAIFNGYEFPPGTAPQLSAAYQFGREGDAAVPTNGVQAALVEIDPGTGIVHHLKHWAVDDCGRIINPLLVDEQIRGGIVQGLGEALFEACRYDEAGQFTSGTLADYLLPMAVEIPDIVIGHVETPYSGSALGAKGAGEAGTCAAPAAILNAVNDALAARGARVDAFPITPVAVLRALGALDGSEPA